MKKNVERRRASRKTKSIINLDVGMKVFVPIFRKYHFPLVEIAKT